MMHAHHKNRALLEIYSGLRCLWGQYAAPYWIQKSISVGDQRRHAEIRMNFSWPWMQGPSRGPPRRCGLLTHTSRVNTRLGGTALAVNSLILRRDNTRIYIQIYTYTHTYTQTDRSRLQRAQTTNSWNRPIQSNAMFNVNFVAHWLLTFQL